jgi:hypothetical protein
VQQYVDAVLQLIEQTGRASWAAATAAAVRSGRTHRWSVMRDMRFNSLLRVEKFVYKNGIR